MKKKNRSMILSMLAVLTVATVFLSSCVFGGGKSREECLLDFEENYLPQLKEHFSKNEAIFNKLAESLSDYVIGVDDIDSYRTVSLSVDHRAQNDSDEDAKYSLFIARQLNPDDKTEITRNYIDFVNDGAVNKYGLTQEELDKVFEEYRVVYCDSLSDDINRGGSVGFEVLRPAMYNRADRVDSTLWYSKAGGNSDGSPGSINDHWYIIYSLYWSPAI